MSRQEASEPPGQHARAGRLTAGRSRLAETHREKGQEEAGTGTPTAAGASPVMAQPLVSEGLEVACIRQPPGQYTSTATPGIRVTSHKRRGVSFPPLPALPTPHKSKFEGKLPRSIDRGLSGSRDSRQLGVCIHSVVTPSFIPRLLPGRAGGSSPHSDTTEGQTIDYPGNLREKAVQGQTQESSAGRQAGGLGL